MGQFHTSVYIGHESFYVSAGILCYTEIYYPVPWLLPKKALGINIKCCVAPNNTFIIT